ncbi:AmmeMemoRadiSam system protein B [Psychrosphaera sp. B3R10]|uniref:AmmeMemoRadiSam system protein B n=1 Tax=Psychrosphaera algicola TaxID=3023714 RepID=A0ABT5FC18_9GAMM|nr:MULTISPECIES: AmmeMemoRadiSam system protein B [unclassified Psychrosphaera]MBU2881112.1 AmmeMemoRadiSam system protein B [Psychrosphaera sp. I2R16]MBU2990036.1 AmmeMemoRadiSam system protein B [Psychrosphaera sp. B3R10]MDC2889096.1 AmmeMemoRadiSam system protein B [Psychrosphaera sp. G1-22]MDO6721181.1 AmmeMemoRadiSam system protein B [Psychrosphaera sp. 1_MG-2023]
MVIRPACAAGHNYPADADELITVVAKLLLAYPIANVQPYALVVPHNAIQNCGEITAAAYRHLSKVSSVIDQVVVISCIEGESTGIHVPACDQFTTPLGAVPINKCLSTQLQKLPFVVADDTAHYHSARIEVQLPYLQTCLTDFSIMPVLIGDVPSDELSLFFHSLPTSRNTLIILSLDVKEQDIEEADLDEQSLFVSFLEFCNDVKWQIKPALAETEFTDQNVATSFIAH